MQNTVVIASMAVGGGALAMGTLFKPRAKTRANPNVKVLIIDGTEASSATVLDAAQKPLVPEPDLVPTSSATITAHVELAAIQPEILAAPLPTTTSTITPQDDEPVAETSSREAEDVAEPEYEQAHKTRRPFGFSFLQFGMRRREALAQPVAQSDADLHPSPTEEGSVMLDRQDVLEEVEAPIQQSRVRKLFSGFGRGFVRKAAPVAAEHEDDHAFVAEVETEGGTVAIDEKGALQEIPAEMPLPVEQFARADAAHDAHIQAEQDRAATARANERRAALEVAQEQHRLELERVAAAEAAKQADHDRELARIQAEAAARAQAESYTSSWWIRLDPEIAEPTDAQRLRLAASLENVPAPWAGKLIARALEQDDNTRVRARLIGALARGGHRSDAAPFMAAYARTEFERWAVIEALSPFADEASWIADLVNEAHAPALAKKLPENVDLPETTLTLPSAELESEPGSVQEVEDVLVAAAS